MTSQPSRTEIQVRGYTRSLHALRYKHFLACTAVLGGKRRCREEGQLPPGFCLSLLAGGKLQSPPDLLRLMACVPPWALLEVEKIKAK